MAQQLSVPLSNIQMELLKLYSTGLSEEGLKELKIVLARFFAERSIRLANKVWQEKGYTDADMDRLLNSSLTK